jgi:hypothetical protein
MVFETFQIITTTNPARIRVGSELIVHLRKVL